MPHTPHTTGSGEPMIYRIRVKGRLASRWAHWFAPLTVTPQPDGTTLLTGPVTDQAELHGQLRRLRDLGLPLVSVAEIDTDPTTVPGSTQE